MKKTKVLIVGAGPTGLMLSCQLHRYGLDHIIIDSKSGPTLKSKALAVQGRTMEIYDQMGLMDKAKEDGHVSDGALIYTRGKKAGELSLGHFGKGLSPFPFLFILEQSKNEALLYAYIKQQGGEVLWNTKYLSADSKPQSNLVSIEDPEGNNIQIEADFLIGCDGSHSPIRKHTNIDFLGGTYEELFLVADLEVNWDIPYDRLCLMMEPNTFAAFFPMDGKGRMRLVSIVPDKFEEKDELSFSDLVPFISSNLSVPMSFGKVKWFATYKVHYKYVTSFIKDNILLAGDAAHIHSPAGGQGMNTGLQDAYNLAWKLHWVINKKANPALIQSYSDERQPNAKQLIDTTDRGFQFIAGNGFFQRLVRTYLFPFMAQFAFRLNFTRKRAYKTVSQIDINYHKTKYAVGSLGAWKAGFRLPYLKLQRGSKVTSTFNLLKNTSFNILLFNVGNRNDIEQVLQDYPSFQDTQIHIIEANEENTRVLSSQKIKTSMFCLVRPDQHIGFISKDFDKIAFEKYLSLYI